MLEPNEKFVFDGMVSQMRAGDPRFHRRLSRLTNPRRGLRLTVAILLWTLAPVSVYLGGWTGLLMAAVAVFYGARLITRMPRFDSSPYGPSSQRRPGASL